MPQMNIPDDIANTLFPPDPKIKEYANLLLGDTVKLEKTIKEIEDAFEERKREGGSAPISIGPKDIVLGYEQWRAIKKALYISSAYFKEQVGTINAMKKTMERYEELASVKIDNTDIKFL